MTVTYDSVNDQITIQSNNIITWTSIDTVVLTSKINCGTTEYSVTLTDPDVDASGNYTINNSTFYNVTSLDDSLYSFKLTITMTDTTQTIENACLFIDNETLCDVAKAVRDTADTELQLDYYLLQGVSGCNCNCADFCNIYDRVKAKLEDCNCC